MNSPKALLNANKDDGTQSPGILVNADTLAIAPDDVVNVESFKQNGNPGIQVAGGTLELGNNTHINNDIVVDKAGTLYAKAGTQTVDSLVLNGTFQADIHGDNYTQIRSKGDITIGGDASLVINAADLTDADGISFKNILASATKIDGQFGSVSSNSRLFDFTAEYDKQSTDTVKAVHLLATAKPVTPEPTPEPTPTPEPAPSIGLVENIVNKADDSVVSPVARTP